MIAVERRWTVASVFTDHPTTVRKGLDCRAGDLALVDAIRSGGVDKVLIFDIDRVGRSLAGLVTLWKHAGRLACRYGWTNTAGSNGLPIFDVVTTLVHHVPPEPSG